MVEAGLTHEGDNCTFEVLLERGGLNDPALRPIAEIIHAADAFDQRLDARDLGSAELAVLQVDALR